MSQVNQIKDAINIVDEIGQRLELKRAGSSFKALCPFHSEKSPSFFVNPQLQRYRCFGCGASGDVIQFLEQYEGMTFMEALRYLADKAGIKLQKITSTQDDEMRDQLMEILNLASQYYAYLLSQHKLGKMALDYLKKRGVSQSSIETFKLGYALDAWDGLFNYLTKKKRFQPSLVEKTGLVIRNRSGRYYDRFRNRIVFPLKNHRGQIVGFSGRTLPTEDTKDSQPKYINTPETQLYHKSQMLYGYSELFQHIRKKGEVIVAEGEFDVISSQQAHVSHIVAIKGSALTQEQVKLLSRVVNKIILCLDADAPGAQATKRAISIIKDLDIDLRVIDLSQFLDRKIHDADELINFNPSLWREVVKKSVSCYDFLIELSLREHTVDSAVGRRRIIDELAPLLNNIPHQVEKDFYLKKLAQKLQVSFSVLQTDISRFGQTKMKRTTGVDESQVSEKKIDPFLQLEDYLLFLLFSSTDEQIQERAEQLQLLELSNSQAKQILTALLKFKEQYELGTFATTLAEDLKAALMEWQQPDFINSKDDLNLDTEWQKTLKKYQTLKIQKQISIYQQDLSSLEEKEDKTQQENNQIDYLLAEIAKLQSKYRTIFSRT